MAFPAQQPTKQSLVPYPSGIPMIHSSTLQNHPQNRPTSSDLEVIEVMRPTPAKVAGESSHILGANQLNQNGSTGDVQITGLSYFENDVHNALEKLRSHPPFNSQVKLHLREIMPQKQSILAPPSKSFAK